MDKNFKLLSKEVTEKNITYSFLWFKLVLKNPNFVDELEIETKKAIKIQNSYDLKPLRQTKKLILFLTPANIKICGGVMSIYSLCETSRKISSNSLCILSTYPNEKYTYSSNEKFPNEELIYRFSQIVNNCKKLEELIVHIPDYYAKDFYKSLTSRDIKFLKSIKKLHLNIMNQNIELMPEPEELKDLYKLTNNITQTVAHNRYATQEVCDKWQIPTHLFSVNIDSSKYKSYPFEEKEKNIVVSPDRHKDKGKIIGKMREKFPDFNYITVQNMTFPEYMDLIARSYFTVSFGEGMDGYFIQPSSVGSVGITVYNNKFFPDASWKDLFNVYESYEMMADKILNDLEAMLNDKKLYEQTSNAVNIKLSQVYSAKSYNNNLKRFYENKYDFYPLIKKREN